MRSIEQLKQEIKKLGRKPMQEAGIYDLMEQAGQGDMVSVNIVIMMIGDFKREFQERFDKIVKKQKALCVYGELIEEILEKGEKQ